MDSTRILSALHVRTGDPAAAELIDIWSRTHGVEVAVCGDAYDACVHLLKRADQVPDFVFIGADWLAPDELEIVRYARETWPAVGVIVYGALAAPGGFARPATIACGSRTELQALLAEPPAALLARLERENEQAATAAGVGSEPLKPIGLPNDTASDAGGLRGILTREELSALLEDDDR